MKLELLVASIESEALKNKEESFSSHITGYYIKRMAITGCSFAA